MLDDSDRAGGDGRELHAAREVALAPRLLGRRGSRRSDRGGKETLVSITRRAASVAWMVYGVPRVMGKKRKQWGKRRRERENEVGGGTPDWLCMRLPREDSPPSSTTAKNTNPSLAPSRHTHCCIHMCRTLSGGCCFATPRAGASRTPGPACALSARSPHVPQQSPCPSSAAAPERPAPVPLRMAPAVPVPMRRPHPNRPPSLAQAAPAAEAPDASQPPEAAAEEEPL